MELAKNQIAFKSHFIFIDDLPPHLHGLTFYGENIEDEWFIVDLLYKLTKLHKGLIVRVVDSDGEFILIEAANHLPAWANPDTCQQRVSNQMQLIFNMQHAK